MINKGGFRLPGQTDMKKMLGVQKSKIGKRQYGKSG